MKKLYEKYLHVPEEGKIKEKVFMCRIAVAIVCMVCCLSAMGFSAYAYFTSSVTSSANTIQAASYSTEITIVDSTAAEVTSTVNDVASTYYLGVGTYTVEIKALGTARTGYCKIEVGKETYYTVPIIPNGDSLSFTIECNESSRQISIISNWGSCSETDEAKIIANEGSILIGTPTTGNSEPSGDTQVESAISTESTTVLTEDTTIPTEDTDTSTNPEEDDKTTPPDTTVDEDNKEISNDSDTETTPEEPKDENSSNDSDSTGDEENTNE